jgi:hypothetical protein
MPPFGRYSRCIGASASHRNAVSEESASEFAKEQAGRASALPTNATPASLLNAKELSGQLMAGQYGPLPPEPPSAQQPPVKPPWLNSQAHITISGLAMFLFMAVGIIWPQYKPKADELAVAAGTYLFASAKAK